MANKDKKRSGEVAGPPAMAPEWSADDMAAAAPLPLPIPDDGPAPESSASTDRHVPFGQAGQTSDGGRPAGRDR